MNECSLEFLLFLILILFLLSALVSLSSLIFIYCPFNIMNYQSFFSSIYRKLLHQYFQYIFQCGWVLLLYFTFSSLPFDLHNSLSHTFVLTFRCTDTNTDTHTVSMPVTHTHTHKRACHVIMKSLLVADGDSSFVPVETKSGNEVVRHFRWGTTQCATVWGTTHHMGISSLNSMPYSW